MHAHLIKFSHRSRSQSGALVFAQAKFREHRLGLFHEPLAKSRIIIGEIKKLVDLKNAHGSPLSPGD